MKILYISCHQVLEYDELKLFYDLGHEVLSIGFYLDPSNPSANSRPAISNYKNVDSKVIDEFFTLNPNYKLKNRPNIGDFKLTESFLKNFDCIITEFHFEELEKVWKPELKVPLIVRSPGQPSQWFEHYVRHFKSLGAKIVRFSPAERFTQGYCGEDAIIRLYVNPEEYQGWKGLESNVLFSVCNNALARRKEVNLDNYLFITKGYNTELYGYSNRDLPQCWGELSNSGLTGKYRTSRAFFSMGTQPGPYTYSFIEAWCTGIPVITWSKGLGGQIIGQNGGNSFEIPDFIDNGVDCISSDSKVELTYALKLLMSDDTFAKGLSEKGRIKCINMFNYSVAKSQWEDLLKQL
jgi:hypothetical protein